MQGGWRGRVEEGGWKRVRVEKGEGGVEEGEGGRG